LKELIKELKQRPQQVIVESSTSVIATDVSPAEYLAQLKSAQDHLLQHNQNISKYLNN
jgi:hypothetical protein